MKSLLLAIAAVSTVVATCPAAAHVVAEGDVARAEGDWGGELALGVPVVADGGFSITPGVGAFFHHRDHPGYEEVNSQCVNQETGNQVSSGKCDDSGTKVFGKVEATYRLPASFAFGVGARFISGNLRAYGTVAMPLAPHIDLKGNLGDHYLAAGLQARF